MLEALLSSFGIAVAYVILTDRQPQTRVRRFVVAFVCTLATGHTSYRLYTHYYEFRLVDLAPLVASMIYAFIQYLYVRVILEGPIKYPHNYVHHKRVGNFPKQYERASKPPIKGDGWVRHNG